MGKMDPRVDAYIRGSAGFAIPILEHLRKVIHQGCPGVEETIKWSFPNFDFKGPMCSMAAFKAHCSFGFWKSELVLPKGVGDPGAGMGQLGRITSIKDLPPKKDLIAYVKKASELNSLGIKKPTASRPKVRAPLEVPDCITQALKKNAKARATFEGFSYSHKKEYVEWITEAKREETRTKRLATMIEWLAEGKSRNWKYASC